MGGNLSHAIKYAQFGWHVFPCNWIVGGRCSCGAECSSPGKHPKTAKGNLDATTDPAVITEWWTKWPLANIAVRTGPDSRIWVLDADLPDGPGNAEKMSLPPTLIQKTGSGGAHYFFQWNGQEIRNSAKKIAPDIDVRGVNGYVLLPPSNHISGSNYEWVNKIAIAKAPQWLTDLVVKKEPTCKPSSSYQVSAYGQKALTEEIIKMSSAGQGTRNQTLNQCAFNLSQLVAGGELERSSVESSLLASALVAGLNESEARKTIESGFKAGLAKPRAAKPKLTETNETNGTNGTNGTAKKLTELTPTNGRLTETNGTNAFPPAQKGRFEGNLTTAIREFIKENQGNFSNSDIDRDFGLTHPADKNLRRQALLTLVKENLIIKDIRLAGKYRILKTEISFIDFDATDPSQFSVKMPLGLSEMVRIPKKSIIVIAGSTNAGKTGLAIEFLRLNLHQPYGLMYLMSEMGPSEYKQRIQTAIPEDDLSTWKNKVRAASINGNFDNAIREYNKDGLTVIDFLEEIDGEYFKIPSDLRAVYDGLQDGIAIVCIQKHSKADVGRGGEGTAEKPRLYLTVDKMAYNKKSTISAVKIYKAKDYVGDNPNGMERHIVFGHYGRNVSPISKWIYCNATQREKMRQDYERKACDDSGWPEPERHCCIERGDEREPGDEQPGNGLCIYFTTASGKTVRVIERDIQKWRENYKNINVDAELLRLSRDSEKNGFINDKGWFHQVSGILSNKNKKADGSQHHE